jgi:hypothetical protein
VGTALATVVLALAAGCSAAVPGVGVASSAGVATVWARQTCADLPTDAVATAFGVTGVTVSTVAGSRLADGVLQAKCAVHAATGFGINVVEQSYPTAVLGSPREYLRTLRRRIPAVRTVSVPGADLAGTFRHRVGGNLVDEAFTATVDTTTGTLDVVLAAGIDRLGIPDQLLAFLTALART